jgi:hypothetical protein
LDAVFADVETADQRIVSDHLLYGILTGLTVAQDSPTGLSAIVAAGTAYDQAGQRIRIPSQQVVDLSVDYLAADTAVSTPTFAKYLSVYVEFDRDLTDPQIDGNGATVYASSAESFAFKVVQGAESLTPTKPTLLTDAILLCDVLLEHGDTAIVNADLDTARRMNLFVIAGSPLAINATSILAALTQILAVVNPHIAGSGQYHGADDIVYNGSPVFADGVTALAAATDLEVTLDSLVTKLATTGSTPAGDDLIGVRQDATQSPTLAAGTLRERLVALRLATNLYYAGSSAWGDATTIAAGTVAAAIDAIVSGLASTSGGRGAPKITLAALGGSPDSISAGTLATGISALLTAVNARARIASAETITAKYTFDLAAPGTGLETAADTTAAFAGPVTIGEDVSFTSTNATPKITQPIRAGTGATDGYDLSIEAQPGQAQTGGADNNTGAAVVRTPGAPGTGGSGAAGEYGDDVVLFNDRQYTRYAEVTALAASATQTARTVTLATGSVVTVEVRCQNKNSNATGGSHVIIGTFRNIAGTTSQQGTTTAVHSASNNTGAAVAFDVTGADVKVDVTAGSAGATTTDFNAFITVSEFTP